MPARKTTTKAPGTKCPITREQFAKSAVPLVVTIGDDKKAAYPKEFSTGSFGWHFNEKVFVEIDGVPCKVQSNVSLVVVGSKDAD